MNTHIVKESEDRLNRRIDDLRTELKDDINSIRNELKDDINSVRNELKGDIADVKGDIATVRWMVIVLAMIVVGAFVLPQFLGRTGGYMKCSPPKCPSRNCQ